jgi:hypothetical protein
LRRDAQIESGEAIEEPVEEVLRSKAKVKQLKTLVKRRMEEKRTAKKLIAPEPAPRYDDVFDKGQEWLDGLAGQPIEPVRGRLQFSEGIWKSSSHREPEIP